MIRFPAPSERRLIVLEICLASLDAFIKHLREQEYSPATIAKYAHDVRALLREFGLPDTHIVWAILALGYPAHEGRLLARRQNVVKWVEPQPLS